VNFTRTLVLIVAQLSLLAPVVKYAPTGAPGISAKPLKSHTFWFRAGSGATLAMVLGVLIEVPVMLSLCATINCTRHWFSTPFIS